MNVLNINDLPKLRAGYSWRIGEFIEVVRDNDNHVLQNFMWTKVTDGTTGHVRIEYFQEIVDVLEAEDYFKWSVGGVDDWICMLCNKLMNDSIYKNNGDPLVDGPVCQDCNLKVVEHRLKNLSTK